MQYDDLIPADKEKLDAWLLVMRPLTGQIQRAVSGAVPLDVQWADSVGGIVASLDVGAMIPNTTGLPAEAVSREDVEAVATTLSQLLSVLNTTEVQGRAIRMAGLANVAGG